MASKQTTQLAKFKEFSEGLLVVWAGDHPCHRKAETLGSTDHSSRQTNGTRTWEGHLPLLGGCDGLGCQTKEDGLAKMDFSCLGGWN